MLKLASAAVDNALESERTVSWLTMSISRQNYPQLLEEIRSFRKRLREFAESDTKANTVYQLNIQMFPVSKTFKLTKNVSSD